MQCRERTSGDGFAAHRPSQIAVRE